MKSVDDLVNLITKDFPKYIDLTEDDCNSNVEYQDWFWDELNDLDQRVFLTKFWEDFAEDIYNLLKNGKE